MKLPNKVNPILDYGTDNQDVFESKLQYLSKAEIFCDLTSEELKDIAAAAIMTTVQAGTVFYTPNERSEILFILKKGHVQLYRMSGEGRKLVIATLGPGTLFGEMTLTGMAMHDAFAEATEEG
jgi:CRP-like cAMP-binding protein